jgi:hypothetical protein
MREQNPAVRTSKSGVSYVDTAVLLRNPRVQEQIRQTSALVTGRGAPAAGRRTNR